MSTQHSAVSTQPTPGPWKYQDGADACTHIVRGPNDEIIVQFRQDTTGVSEANARLTSAVHDLLALKEALGVIYVFHGHAGWELYESSPEMQRFTAAIAKAERRK